jgi:hypothetical protein
MFEGDTSSALDAWERKCMTLIRGCDMAARDSDHAETSWVKQCGVVREN